MSESWESKKEAGMLVPVRPSLSGAVVMYGDGVPPKVGVGASDLPLETWLGITNRHLPGAPYRRAERICVGVLALHDSPVQGKDMGSIKGGQTFGSGQGPEQANPGEMREADEDLLGYETAAWLVTRQDGSKALAVLPGNMNSFEVAEYIAQFELQEFCVEAVFAATYTGAEDLLIPGWSVLVDRRDAIGPQPGGPAPR